MPGFHATDVKIQECHGICELRFYGHSVVKVENINISLVEKVISFGFEPMIFHSADRTELDGFKQLQSSLPRQNDVRV